MTQVTRLLVAIGMLCAAGMALADAGRFQFVNGDVRIVRANASSVIATKGATVEQGDSITTGPGAQAQLVMKDGGIISLRPESNVRIEVYRYSDTPGANNQGFFSLLKGGFRSITGAIGRQDRNSYKVRTPTATIGIRGTDHEPLFIPVPGPGETPAGPPGTYDKVNSGATFLQTDAGRVEVAPNQVGFVPAVGSTPPVVLPGIPDFLKATPNIQASGKTSPESPKDTASSPTSSSATGATAATAPAPEWIRPALPDVFSGPSTMATLLNAMPNDNAPNLSSKTLTYNTVASYTTPVDENGTAGGRVNSLGITLQSLNGVPQISQYDLNLKDAQNRQWTTSLAAGGVALTNLNQNTTNLTVTCAGCNGSTGSGTLQGAAIGNPTPVGFVSTYKLNDGGSATVGGSVVSTK
jgi:hypothetical protein